MGTDTKQVPTRAPNTVQGLRLSTAHQTQWLMGKEVQKQKPQGLSRNNPLMDEHCSPSARVTETEETGLEALMPRWHRDPELFLERADTRK